VIGLRAFLLLGALLAPALPTAAFAQTALYGAQPPRGSAHLRFANSLPQAASVRVEGLAPHNLGTQAAQRIGAYSVVNAVADRAVQVSVESGGQTVRQALHLPSDGWASIMLREKPDKSIELVLLKDETSFNQLRVRLTFYNTMANCSPASLGLAGGGAVVIADVAPGTAGVRSVNPARAVVEARCPGQPAAPVALEGLEAGGTYSIWLMPDAQNQPTAFIAKDAGTGWAP
jgi:hypothetical protein